MTTHQPIPEEKFFTVGDNRKREVTLVARDESLALASRIWDEDHSEDGIISAGAMAEYFPGRPTLHTATPIYSALLEAGCTPCAS